MVYILLYVVTYTSRFDGACQCCVSNKTIFLEANSRKLKLQLFSRARPRPECRHLRVKRGQSKNG